MGLEPAFVGPWRLPPNRVARFYRGGAALERFRTGEQGVDGELPEDWVGSATHVWTRHGKPPGTDGLGWAEADGERRRIDELLAADPDAVAGSDLVAVAGLTTGLLVKLLDAGVRLPVHAHPTRAFARTHLDSFFGKAEAWIVLATRDTGDREGPTVRIGFRRDVGRAELVDLIEAEGTDALLRAMHRRPTQAGDVWFIPPGVPHAIGAGVFMVEIEEPSDFSVVAETGGLPIEPEDAHLGLGWEVAVDAFDRAGHQDAWVDGLRHRPDRPAEGDGWRLGALTGIDADPFFRPGRLEVRGRARPDLGAPSFLVGVVTAGRGTVVAGGRELGLAAGDTFAVPAALLPEIEFGAPDGLELIACLPPRADELARSRGGA